MIRQNILLAFAFITLVAMLYCSTGTFAPYDQMSYPVLLTRNCGYPLSVDYPHFAALFYMLDGKPEPFWHFTEMSRRSMYAMLAFPLAKLWGIYYGGVLFNILANFAAAALLVWHVRRVYGNTAGLAAAWLMATYPGIFYWIGMPAPYAMIVPQVILAYICLYNLQYAGKPSSIALASLGLSFSCMSYDLQAYVLPASVLTIAWRNTGRRTAFVVFLPLFIGPLAIYYGILTGVYHAALTQGYNFGSYTNILHGYIQALQGKVALDKWGAILVKAPVYLISNYLCSNFIAIPLLFPALLLYAYRKKLGGLERFELAWVFVMLGVWCFNNLAPPYAGRWQLRGHELARLYQGWFAVAVAFAARTCAEAYRQSAGKTVVAALAATIAFNGVIVFGPVLHKPALTSWAVYQFYSIMFDASTYSRHLEALGYRPIGFCDGNAHPAFNPEYQPVHEPYVFGGEHFLP